MLSKQEDFDRDVKRVLQEVHGEEIPLDFLVDIEQRLDQLEKKRKRRVFVWFFSGIVLASGLTFGLLRGNGSSNTAVKTTSNNAVVTTPQKGINLATKTKVFKQIVSSKAIQSGQTNAVQIAATQLSGATRKMAVSDPQLKGTVYPSTLENLSDLMQVSTILDDGVTSIPNFEMTETPRDLNSFISDEQKVISSAGNSAKTDPKSSNESANHDSVPAPTIPGIAPLTKDLSEEAVNFNNKPTSPEPGILPIEKEKWVKTFGFFMGMSGIGSSIEVKENIGFSAGVSPDLKKYAEIRNAQERSTSSIDLSLRTSWMKHHFLIQSGVDYFEWGEQLKYDYNIVYDGVNRYSYVSVPLYLGYRQSWKSLELSASIGSSIGGVIKRDGYYLQENLTTIAVEQASNWTTTGYLQLELSYVKDNYRFSIAPTYRRSLTSVIFSGYTRNIYQSFGLQIGMAVILK